MGTRNDSIPNILGYCVGADEIFSKTILKEEVLKKHLEEDDCVGIKLFPGYTASKITDSQYDFIYSLAKEYNKVVTVHTGQTAKFADAPLHFANPLYVDTLARRHPDVYFLICHFGNPWLQDAAAVVERNENVYTDLSGFIENKINHKDYILNQRKYLEYLQMWIEYVDNYDKFIFGTDWPIVNRYEYLKLFQWLIPKEHHQKVFFDNAVKFYNLESKIQDVIR